MNLTEYSLQNPKIIYFFLAVLIVGGVFSFQSLAKKEDAPFVIKSAVLITRYPGAVPEEVERLVTEPIEREVQSLRRVYKIKSESYFGISKITVELEPSTPPEEMPQMWDELRRKVLNIQGKLPEGTSEITVNDDFGDVYGIYYGLTFDPGFSYRDVRYWANYIKTELVPIDGVEKVQIYGEQQEVVNLKISAAKMSSLGIDYQRVIQLLSTQNSVVNTGEKPSGDMQLKVVANGTFRNLDDIKNQVIINDEGEQFIMSDVAEISQDYLDPPNNFMRIDGKPALGIGVATASESDVAATGELVNARLNEIMSQIPVGIELVTIYPEDKIAREANNGFIINLLVSVGIVVLILMLVMGFKASTIIGTSLLFSIGGTLLIMDFMGVSLNRTSLAGFIIAMGMLVDNAIVVIDNAQVGIKKGVDKVKAIVDGATLPQWGLLGATFIAIASFLPLYLAPAAVAEMVSPLFVVIGISLGLSWILALTQTTLFAKFMLKQPESTGKDPYDTKFYNGFSRLLYFLIKHKFKTIFSIILLFFLAMFVMGIMPQNFFPSLDKPYFRADLFLPDGYSIYKTKNDIEKIEDFLLSEPAVKHVSITVGGSPLRYYLASTSFGPKPNFANVLVELHSKDSTVAMEGRFDRFIRDNFPDMLGRSSLFKLSPAVEAVIEVGFIGSNQDTLIRLADQAMEIMRENDKLENIRLSWGNRVPVLIPEYSPSRGLPLAVSRNAMANALKLGTNGINMGVLRENDQNIPILLKDERDDQMSFGSFRTIPITSASRNSIPLEQVVDTFRLDYEFPVLKRYNRQRVIMAQVDPKRGVNANQAFAEVSEAINTELTIPEGYKLKYFGEAESQAESNAALASKMPLTFMLILVTLLFLFRNYRQPLIILLMIPLIFIGVVMGLLFFGKMFDFFALLGLLGLIGMNIKNAIVLVDQINIELANGLEALQAVIVATKSRVIPVIMASGTTILGLLPLLYDSMFGGMAATIMGGLLAASLLTLLILPVTYALFYRIKAS